MFTKELLMEMFRKNEGSNFCIYTNIAEGRGINGVSFKSFIGDGYASHDNRIQVNKTTIKGFADTYLIIEVNDGRGIWYSDSKREVYVPYATIVMVDFLTDESHPLYGFTGKNNIAEI